MNLKEKLADLAKQFDAAETIEEAREIKGQMDEIKERIALIEEKESIMDGLKADEPVKSSKKEAPATLGKHAAAHIAGKRGGEQRFSLVAPEFKAAGDINTIPASVSPALVDYDRNIVGVRRNLALRSMFGTETISGNALTYFVETAVEGEIGEVEENGLKPSIHFGDPTPKTVALTKLAAVYKESDEIIEDANWLATSIDNRALYLMDLKEENFLLSTLLGTSGLGTATKTANILADIKKAKTAVRQASGFVADTVVLNPADYDDIVLNSLTERFFVNPWAAEEPRLWGMEVYQSEDVAAGTYIVGAFKQGASVIGKGGRTVDVTNSNEDDFKHNRVAIRVEERLALAVRYPGAFVKIA